MMSADFTGRTLRLPPGIAEPPSIREAFEAPVWVSPAVSGRVNRSRDDSRHLLVGGRTVWVEGGANPRSILVSHPNGLGAAEDLGHLAELAARLHAEVWVDIDPFLVDSIDLPGTLRSAVSWGKADPTIRARAGQRIRTGADALRRRLAQIPGVSFVIEHQVGAGVTFVTPIPGVEVVAALAEAGASLEPAPIWEGGVIASIGWWHTRRQIDELCAGIAAAVDGLSPKPVNADRYDSIPDDLPLRRLDTI
jgi:hypothetical protein